MNIESLKTSAGILLIAGLVTLTGILAPVHAAQIAPNPNPTGNTITVTGADWNSLGGIVFINSGTLNIDPGGTLTNSGGLGNDSDATITNNGTLSSSGAFSTISNWGSFINSGTLTNSGWLRNFGTIRISPTGTLTQDAAATCDDSGSIILNGTLTNNQNAAFNVNSLTVDSSQTGVLSGTGTSAITTGNISGTLNYTGTNSLSFTTLNLTGGVLNNSSTGSVSITTTTVAGGSTGAIGGTGTITLQTANVGGTLTISAILSGVGSLTKTGAGTLTLTGANTYTGATTINTGTLSVNGTITSPVTILTAGTLMGTGSITGNVTNNGIIRPGNSIGTLTINGDYTHNANSVYEVEVNPAGQSDKLVISGTATLNGGTVSVLAGPATNYGMRTQYTILTAGAVSGTFGNVTSDLAFLTPSLSYDPTNVYLVLARTANFADVAITSNQKAVASALDRISSTATGDMGTVMDTLLGLTSQEAREAYNQMGGLSHTAFSEVSFFSFTRYMETIAERMGGLITRTTSHAYKERPIFASRSDVTWDTGSPFLAGPGNLRAKETPPWGLWVKGYGNSGERRGDDVASKYDYHMAGALVGLDTKLGDTVLLGLSMGYSYSTVSMKDLSDTGRVSSEQVSLYGVYLKDPWYVKSIMAYGYNRYDTARSISFGGINRRAEGDYRGYALGGYMEGGYRFLTDTMDIMDIIPVASFQGSYLNRRNFREEDALSLNLDVDGERTSSFLSSLGVILRKGFKTQRGVITPEIQLRWLHEFSNDRFQVNGSFADAPLSTFTVEGDRPDKDGGVFGFGLTWETKSNFSFCLAYDARVSEDRTEQGGSLGIRYQW